MGVLSASQYTVTLTGSNKIIHKSSLNRKRNFQRLHEEYEVFRAKTAGPQVNVDDTLPSSDGPTGQMMSIKSAPKSVSFKGLDGETPETVDIEIAVPEKTEELSTIGIDVRDFILNTDEQSKRYAINN